MTEDPHPRPRPAAPRRLLDRLLSDPLASRLSWIPIPEDDLDRADIDGYVCASPDDPRPPHVPAEEIDRLDDPAVREHFVERLYAHARLRELFSGEWTPGDLVAFHSRHKLQILAHDPAGYRAMGRIVAEAGTRPRAELEADYRRAFGKVLAARPTRGRHTNALMHVLGPMRSRLDQDRRRAVAAAIDAYYRGEVPLDAPIALLRETAEAVRHTYLSQQTYLDPYPADLLARA